MAGPCISPFDVIEVQGCQVPFDLDPKRLKVLSALAQSHGTPLPPHHGKHALSGVRLVAFEGVTSIF